MRLLTKISSEGRSDFLLGLQTLVTPNATVTNRKWRALAEYLVIFVAAFCGTASPAKEPDVVTGICFRRITALDRKGVVINRYETVLIKRSENLAADLKRVEKFTQKGSPVNSPDLKPFVWIGAAISDRSFDEVSGIDCSHLPNLHR